MEANLNTKISKISNLKVFDNENQIPVVGKFYNIKCAEMRYNNGEIVYIPIIGKKHKDLQFGVTYEHYHIDGRFNGPFIDKNGFSNSVLPVTEDKDDYHFGRFLGIVIKRKKCMRITTGIKPNKDTVSFHNWYKTMIGKSCKGKKCPHLGTTMMEVNGRLECPLHKLQGCTETFKIIEFLN